MDPLELNAFSDISGDVCRICLQKDVILNWNNEIPEYFGLTYRECYYKYTQLELLVIDPYSEMLCQTCAVDLKDTHFLIIKALESHAILQQTHLTESQIISIENENNQFNEDKEEYNVDSGKSTGSDIGTLDISIHERKKPIALNKPKWKDIDEFEENVQVLKTTTSPSSTLEKNSFENIIKIELAIDNDSDDEEFSTISPNIEMFNNGKMNKKTPHKSKENTKKEKKTYMCSNCSKVFLNLRSLMRHEVTHNKNRERSEICTTCGLKFFDKPQLTLHLSTHNEFREKKYKCEFCDRAYYNMGSLNVHRRIHLGQMISCPLCSKEFFRQEDLNRHNVTVHSSTTIHTDVKKKSKYWVFCKDCNKQIRSTTWKGHHAAHLNEPLMKCSICHRDFFTRSTLTNHMHKVHNYKTRDEYEQFILYTKPKRLSHLWLEQQYQLKPKTS